MNIHYLRAEINKPDKMNISKWIYTTIHEMTHSLVFSPYLFGKYIKEKHPVVIKHGIAYVTAPSIVALAKKHFNCDTIDKVPLENEVRC